MVRYKQILAAACVFAALSASNVITEILLKDLQKIRRIPCKQEKNTGEENKNEKK